MKRTSYAARIAYGALFLSLSLALSWLEMQLPQTAFLPPGVKLGLSNVVTMYCLFFVGALSAFLVAFLKSCFVFLMRGSFAGLFSLLGGLCSVTVMLLFSRLLKRRISYLMLSILGAVFHNLGQLAGVFMTLSRHAWIYAPALVLSGIVMGTLTGLMLKVILPALSHLSLSDHRDPKGKPHE